MSYASRFDPTTKGLPKEALVTAQHLVVGSLVRWEGSVWEVRKLEPRGTFCWIWLWVPGEEWVYDPSTPILAEPTLSVGKCHRFVKAEI